MKKSSTIQMGNDEFILYIRKTSNCGLVNNDLGKKIWEWILSKDQNAIEVIKDEPCMWGDNTPNTDPRILPKTATQFKFNRSLLPHLYDFLDELKS